jgi:hypothetical protein
VKTIFLEKKSQMWNNIISAYFTNGTGDVEDQGKEIKEHTVGIYLRKEKNDSFPPFIFKRFNPLKWRVEKRKIRIGQVSSHVFPFLNCLFIILTPAWNNLVLLAFFLV